MIEDNFLFKLANDIAPLVGLPPYHPEVTKIVRAIQGHMQQEYWRLAAHLSREAEAYRRGELRLGNGAETYDGALRRAARIVASPGHQMLPLCDYTAQEIADILTTEPRHRPLTDEPCGVIPTPRGLDYLAIRRQQHPKEA